MLLPKVAVIVLNYHGEQVLSRCLASLERTIAPEDAVWVVDNGNESDLLAKMREQFPWIQVIALPQNRGFAAGMNAGLHYALEHGDFDAFWLLNNDVTVFPETLLGLKLAFREKGMRALFSPIIYPKLEAKPWFAGGKIDFMRMRTLHIRGRTEAAAPYETDFLTGCALFIPREAIQALGFLDERYFLYYEDAEYSLRAKRQDFPLWVVPGAKVLHSEESRENPAKTYWLVRSGAEFFLRESQGAVRLWVFGYYTLRRLKNWLEVSLTGRRVAREVKRAYTDVSL